MRLSTEDGGWKPGAGVIDQVIAVWRAAHPRCGSVRILALVSCAQVCDKYTGKGIKSLAAPTDEGNNGLRAAASLSESSPVTLS